MKKFFATFFIAITLLPASAEIITTRQPYYGYKPYNQHGYRMYYNPMYRDNLSALEKYALKKNYSRENDINRLERLETLAFGSIQSGDFETRYKNVENAILSRPQNNYKRSLLNNIGNYFAGQMTGFTPNLINSFPNGISNGFYPSYSNTRIDQYSNGIFGGGYRNFGNEYGSGSSIRLLD